MTYTYVYIYCVEWKSVQNYITDNLFLQLKEIILLTHDLEMFTQGRENF